MSEFQLRPDSLRMEWNWLSVCALSVSRFSFSNVLTISHQKGTVPFASSRPGRDDANGTVPFWWLMVRTFEKENLETLNAHTDNQFHSILSESGLSWNSDIYFTEAIK